MLNPFKRNTEDPLIKALVKKYSLNMLVVPRENASVGDVYLVDGNSNRASTPGNIRYLLDPPFNFPKIVVGERFSDIEGVETGFISVNVAFEFLEKFLNMLAPINLGTKFHGRVRSKNIKEIKFRFDSCTRDYVDVNELGIMLPGHKFATKSASYLEGRRYYLVTGVVRSPAISIITENENSSSTSMGAEALKLASGSAELTVKSSKANEVSFNGRKSLALGVELYEMIYDAQLQELKLKTVEQSLLLKGKPLQKQPTEKMMKPAFIGDEEGEAFITVTESKSEG